MTINVKNIPKFKTISATAMLFIKKWTTNSDTIGVRLSDMPCIFMGTTKVTVNNRNNRKIILFCDISAGVNYEA